MTLICVEPYIKQTKTTHQTTNKKQTKNQKISSFERHNLDFNYKKSRLFVQTNCCHRLRKWARMGTRSVV